MKSKIWVAAALGLLATALSAPVATAQCGSYPGMMIKFDGDAWAYEPGYDAANIFSTAGNQLTVVGTVSVFCYPFANFNPANPDTEYTFIWDGLVSQGTTSVAYLGTGRKYMTNYVGGNFRIYAGSPRNAPTVTPPALPAGGIVPDAFVDGTMILGGTMGPLYVEILKLPGGTSYSGSFRADYWGTGGTLYGLVEDASSLLTGLWCPVPPSTSKPGTCSLPTGWSAHPSGKWDMPGTVPTLPSTWGKIKTLYR
jgi:hypothetical protein